MPVPRDRSVTTVLKPSDELLLQWLHRFHYLTSRQLCRLSYSLASITYVQAKLKRLTDAGFCQRIWLPRRQAHGSAPSVYLLARRGLNHLRESGMEVARRFHPSEKRRLSYLFLDHTLELNDALINLEILCRGPNPYRLQTLLHDHDLKRQPVQVERSDGTRAIVVPDAWVDLRLHEKYQVCLAIELDRGTEEQRRWRRKVANLISYANGPYQEAFGTKSLTIAVITTAGERRLLELIRWTEKEMAALGESSQGDLFLFASLPPSLAESAELFGARCWYQPFKQEPLALLEGSG